MPRRRKKSTQQRKPSLIFTESPVNIQHHVPTPVLGAQHPPTVKSVLVEDLQDLSWVSPQFRRHTGSEMGRGRQATRLRRRNLSANCSPGERNHLTFPRSKFKSLKFMGDQTTIESCAEDVEISIESGSNTDDVQTGNEISSSDANSGSDLDLSTEHTGITRRLRSRSKRAGASAHRTLRHRSLPDISCKSASMATDGDGVSKVKTPERQHGLLADRANISNSCHSDSDAGPVARLFSTPEKCKRPGSENNTTQNQDEFSNDTQNETPLRFRRRTRWKTSNATHNKVKQKSVLVCDTPEALCGMPLRRRQMKRLRKRDLLCH